MALKNLADEIMNPYPGLRPFAWDESQYFFGRENESSEIKRKLLKNGFVAIAGESGSGKSSLVQCGLFPMLTRSLPGTNETWDFITTKPGRDPLGNLASSLSGVVNDKILREDYEKDILDLLERSPEGILLAIDKLAPFLRGKILLFIDQLEEVFRYRHNDAGDETGYRLKKFFNLLSSVVGKETHRVYIVVAIRTDMIAYCGQYGDFAEMLGGSGFYILPMNGENLEKAVTGPLKTSGVEINPELVKHIVDKINGINGQLLLLQHVMNQTWARWKEMNEPGRPIDFADCGHKESIQSGISVTAEEIFHGFDKEKRNICERLFRSITAIDPANKNTRFPVSFGKLKASISCKEEELAELIDSFSKPDFSFLNMSETVSLTDDTLIDLSYEPLILLWGRLEKWTELEAESVQMYMRLSEASALYQQGKAGLLKQPDLQAALTWREQNKPTLDWAEKYDPAFERAMVFLRTSEKAFIDSEERARRQSRLQMKRAKTISTTVGSLALLMIVIMIISIVSKWSSDNRRKEAEEFARLFRVEKNAAEHYAEIALQRSLEADSNAILASRREQLEKISRENAENLALASRMAADKAIMKSRVTEQARILAVKRADSAILAGNEIQRVRMISVARAMSLKSQQEGIPGDLQALLAFQASLFNKRNNGNVNDADIYMGLYKLAKQQGSPRLSIFDDFQGPVRKFVFLPGKKRYITADNEGRLLLYDMNGREKGHAYKVLYSDAGLIDVMAISPEADWLAHGDSDNSIRMISLDGAAPNYKLNGHTGEIKSLAFSYDGKSLYSAAIDGKVLKWDLESRNSIEIETDRTIVTSLDVSYDNHYIAGVTEQGQGIIWDAGGKPGKLEIGAGNGKIRCIRFKPDEGRVAVGYDDGKVELWDIETARKLSEFQAHEGRIIEIRFNPLKPQIATSADDGTLRLWDSDDFIIPPVCFTDNGGIVIGFDFSPDGEVIFSGSIGQKPKVMERPTYADSFAADGCSYVTRNFTPDEWVAYVGRDIKYEPTCSESIIRIKRKELR